MGVHHRGTPTRRANAASTVAACHERWREEGSVHSKRDSARSSRSTWTAWSSGAIQWTAGVASGPARTHEKSPRGSRRRLTHGRSGVEVEVAVRRWAVRVELGTICKRIYYE